MNAMPRLVDKPVTAFRRDGGLKDIAAPDPAAVDFFEMAGSLSRIARFNGWANGTALSVAQHCVMGAQAILNEGGTRTEAALFLLHDGHEWLIGDITTPAQELLCALLPSLAVKAAIGQAKAAWDKAIYLAADLPPPSRWLVSQKLMVKSMDGRMCAAEAVAMFGERARSRFPAFVPPRTSGAIRPWGAQKAEEEFITALTGMIGETPIARQAAFATARSMR